MIRTKKIAILAIIAMVFTLMPAAMFAATDNRLAGADRISTAIAIADEGWTTAGTVVLAPADQANLVDALAAAPLAGAANAPILLTFKSALNDDVKAKIAALGATKVYVVGAISADVLAEVDAMAGVTAEQLAGANRWATADAINAKLTSPAGTFVVGYNAIADALSVASYAAANNYAIVLAKADGTVDASKLVGSKTYLVGGTAVVADYAGATRLGGADRFATNAAVASGLTFNYGTLYVANGLSMVDALSAAPLAAKTNSFVALASATSVAADVSSANVIAVGGSAVVSDAVKASVDTSTGTLAVTSVSAPNLGQIKVVFNKAVKETSAETPGNYTLVAKNSGLATLVAATYTLQADDKTLIIDLATISDNQKDYTLTIKDVRDTSGAKLSETSTSFLATDMTLPVVEKVEVTGTKTLKVTMSEPVVATGAQTLASFKIDSGAVSAPSFVVSATPNRNIITLTLAAELSVGNHTVTIKDVKDLAGFLSASNDVSITYAKDASAPTVSIKEVKSDAKTVVLKFNKDIDGATLANNNVKFSHTYNGSNEVLGAAAGVVTAVSPSEYKILFANELPPGTSSVFIKYASGVTDNGKVKDLFGNILSLPLTLQATVTADLVAPTVTSVSQKDADEIYVNFSEDVNAADAAVTGNYKLVNSKNETISLASATYVAADKRTTLKGSANLKAGEYTLEVRNIHDKAVVPNKMVTVVNNISLVDKVAPVISVVAYDATDKKITVKFSKDMAGTGLTTLSNYALYVGGASKSWPTGTSATLKDSKTVEISLGSSITGLDGAGDTIQISGALTSSAGVSIGGISVTENVVAAATVAPAYVTDSAKVTKKDTITFELDSELKAIDATKIQFGGVAITSASYVNEGNKSVVTLKIPALATTDAANWAAKNINFTAVNAVDSTFGGTNAVAQVVAGANIKDKAAPYITISTTSDADADGQIDRLTVVFSESVLASSIDTTDFSLSDSYSVHSVISANANTVVLKLNESGLPDTGVVPTITLAGTIEDLAANSTNSGDAVVSTDGAAPVLLSVNTALGVGPITMTFSENVTSAPLLLADFAGTTVNGVAITALTAAADATAGTTIVTNGDLAPAGLNDEDLVLVLAAAGQAKIVDAAAIAVNANGATATDADMID